MAKEKTNQEFQKQTLKKLGIEKLNPMQEEASNAIQSTSDVVLLSPTGTGKTLAFLMPLIAQLDADCDEIQLLILVPSRELAQQIEKVARNMGSGFKINSVYGGRAGALDKIDLKTRPAILIGTPGRVADRFRRDDYSLDHIQTLVLDEFDKSLEIGFEKEMAEIIYALPNVKQRVLTSATQDASIPEFVGLKHPIEVNYLSESNTKRKLKILLSEDKDKLQALKSAIDFIGPKPGIIFCNYKDALDRVSTFMEEHNIDHASFHGGMEQIDRERSLIKFRNGTCQLLLATDLAARGLDIPEIEFILHYHLPLHEKEFIHRNGRTARMNKEGVAYILHWEEDELPSFIAEENPERIEIANQARKNTSAQEKWTTLYITGGRRDKISKGDIAGFFLKQSNINKNQLGVIELKQNCAYVGVHAKAAKIVMKQLNNQKLKTKKVRISEI
ncbi:DEAD/DEAH box helicase [Brumimicrobium aurantiacum]|uniref:ATP-dependent helicase n=1 Tax=Brumimicrobium aurantiacum TaxID=1737063 RepID=A0A3E1EXN5_9FLAO|nr:DEAD/DEAH box helicase [Brumimicrobium aurantiacum]RFC54320.1 ATP-dependent helicase [Brumimicrobium aurantiacum]